MLEKNILGKAIDLIVKAGVQVTLVYDTTEHKTYLNLNTETKSHLHLYVDSDDTVTFKMRYGAVETFNLSDYTDEHELLEAIGYLVKSCMHGRDYINHSWAELMVNLGILKVNKTVTVSYT